MSDSGYGFAHLNTSSEGVEDSHWRSFVDVMMLILIIFLLIMLAVVAANTRLTENVRQSLMAKQKAQEQAVVAQQKEQEAKQLAEFRLKANSTLEEQLEYLQQRAGSLEIELLKSRAEVEAAQTANSEKTAEFERLQTLTKTQADSLESREKTYNDLQTQLATKNNQAASLETELDRTKRELADLRADTAKQTAETDSLRKQALNNTTRLSTLQGEYDELDKKYQKLLKPARSTKNKQVVEVIYQKGSYSVRAPNSGNGRVVDKSGLESELNRLKAEYGTNLYVKIIIPENSGLSYNEAWRFTNEMLNKYDYYYQPDNTNQAISSP